jgi:hypothetical protein
MGYSLTTPFDWIETYLNAFFAGRYWQFKVLTLALLVSTSTLLVFNSILIDRGFRSLYQEMRHPGSVGGLFWDDIIEQGKDPFTQKNYEPGTHEANQTFRLTIPLIAAALRLNVATLYLLHVVVGLVFLWLMTKIVSDLLQNRVLTFYFMTGFTAIYAGANFYINYLGHCDVFPFCFMLLAFYYRQVIWVFLFSQLAFWCDERAIINSSYIGLWFLWPWLEDFFKTKRLHFNQIPRSAIALVMSAVVYLGIRQWLTAQYGLKIGHDNDLSRQTALWSLSIIGDKFTRAFEGFWLILFAGVTLLTLSKKWWLLLLLLGCFGATASIGIMVADGTRSLSFGFLIFLFLLTILKEHIPASQFKYLLIISGFISIMLPMSFP